MQHESKPINNVAISQVILRCEWLHNKKLHSTDQQEAQLMLTTGLTRLAVNQGQQT